MVERLRIGPVRRRGSVTLDASGNGEVDFDVWSAWNEWEIHEVVVNTNQGRTNPPYPQATVYVGGVAQGHSEGGTWDGNQDTFVGKVTMTACDTLSVQFTGGLPGSIATAILEGTNYLWR